MEQRLLLHETKDPAQTSAFQRDGVEREHGTRLALGSGRAER
jgi:hypothetical protein